MDGQMSRNFSRACSLWLSSLMGTRAISIEDLASLEFLYNVFVELTPGHVLERYDCDLPSVSAIGTGDDFVPGRSAPPTNSDSVGLLERSDLERLEKSDLERFSEESDFKGPEKSDFKGPERSDFKGHEKFDFKGRERYDFKGPEKSDFKGPERSDFKGNEKSASWSGSVSDVVQVIKSPDLRSPQIYRVSEKLCEQSVRLKKAMFFHISHGRARGANPLVLQRLASIRRVVNLERLALFHEAEQADLVLEFFFRSLTQIAWGESAARERFDSLHAYSREVISFYMEAKIKEMYREDYHLVQMEEMQRQMRTQVMHEQARIHDEMRESQALVAEVTERNRRLCSYFEQVAGQSLEREVRFLRWDVALTMRALAASSEF